MMIKIANLLVLILTLNGIYLCSSAKRGFKKFVWPKIYIFGDSLTQRAYSESGNWAGILSNELTRNADVIARGFSGYNTRQGRALLPYLRSDLKQAQIAGIFLGANDASDPTTSENQAVSVEEYKENLKAMIKFMKKFKNIKSIFLITPPAFNEEMFKETHDTEEIQTRKTTKLVDSYIAACIETAEEAGVAYIDVQSAMMERNDWKGMLKDGLHFNAKGSEFFANLLLPRLRAMLSENNIGGGQNGLFPTVRDMSNEDPNASIVEWFKTKL